MFRGLVHPVMSWVTWLLDGLVSGRLSCPVVFWIEDSQAEGFWVAQCPGKSLVCSVLNWVGGFLVGPVSGRLHYPMLSWFREFHLVRGLGNVTVLC